MVEVKPVRQSFSVGGLSKRAQEVLTRFATRSTLSTRGEGPCRMEVEDVICVPQKEVAKELGCSRWTIGRAINKLKEAGLLMETGRDKQSRCKTYALQAPSPQGGEGLGVRFPKLDPGSAAGVTRPGVRFSEVTKSPQAPLCQRGEIQLQNYRRTFELNFIHWPDWEKHYAAVTWELKDVECIHKLFRQTFDRLYEIRDKDLQAHLTQTSDTPPVYSSRL